MMRHLPNLITVLRIVLTPFLGYWIAGGDARRAFPWLAAAVASDAVDGWLARRFGWTSRAGAYLDPVADKFMAATLFVALALGGRLPWWLVGLVFTRDALILLFATWALRCARLRDFPPSLWGKLSTAMQSALAVACVLDALLPGGPLAAAAKALVTASAAATVWSGLHYAWVARRMLRETED